MEHNAPSILIVYNADSGLLNMVAHAIHKTVKPETYPCSLCAVTYGSVSMKRDWKTFLDGLPNQVVFHHKDDFEDAYPGFTSDLPAIFTHDSRSGLAVLIDRAELDLVADVYELIPLVRGRLADLSKATSPAKAA